MTQPSSSRNGARVRLVAIHTAEGARTVESLDAFFRRERSGSSHAGADDHKLVDGGTWVPYDRASWTLRSGNAISDNLELCGFARWSRAEWLSHPRMLDHAAHWIAKRCRARGIPCVKLTPEQVRAGEAGVIGHHDWTVGMRDGDHWDPGPHFPWDTVISRAQQIMNGVGMSPDQAKQLQQIYDWTSTTVGLVRAVRADVLRIDGVTRAQLSEILRNTREPVQISAADIAALIPDSIATDVLDALVNRLK